MVLTTHTQIRFSDGVVAMGVWLAWGHSQFLCPICRSPVVAVLLQARMGIHHPWPPTIPRRILPWPRHQSAVAVVAVWLGWILCNVMLVVLPVFCGVERRSDFHFGSFARRECQTLARSDSQLDLETSTIVVARVEFNDCGARDHLVRLRRSRSFQYCGLPACATSYACKLARVQRGREEKECIWNSTRFGLKETDLHFLNRTELQSKENLTLSLGKQTVLQLALRNDIPMSSI
jgi:hypothetical protein